MPASEATIPPASPPVATSEPVRIADPRPARKQAFALTPLADVMFQLLIFFMLSSSLSPYALLPLVAPAESAPGQAAAAPSTAPAAAPAIWTVGRGEIRAGGTVFAADALPAQLAQLRQAGVGELLLFTTAETTTQDVAKVLEAVRVAGLARARLIGRGGT